MARRAKHQKVASEQPPETVNATQRAQSSAAVAQAASGRIVPNHELNVLGSSNHTRYFDLQDPSNGPSVILRQVFPWACLVEGFSASSPDGISAGDTGAATDTSVADPSQALYPITVQAQQLESSLWPVLENLFSSGTGTRYQISFSEFVRYNAMLLDAFRYMQVIIQVNQMTYHYDWSKVFPFTEDVPKWLYTVAKALDATDVGLASRYLPLIKRFDNKIAFPRMIEEAKRMVTPMLSVDLNGRLQAPFGVNVFNTTADEVETRIRENLDYIDTVLAKASALFQTFLPFPMLRTNPWVGSGIPSIDVDRDSGWWNSGPGFYNTFGDTNDPTIKVQQVFLGSAFQEATTIITHTRHVQPIWSELRMGNMWQENWGILDDTYQLASPHKYGNAYIPADDSEFFVYAGQQYNDSSDEARYGRFVNSRYVQDQADWGVLKPGVMGATVSLESVRRLSKVDVDYAFSVALLKEIMVRMSGASLRELRSSIEMAVYADQATGV